MADETIDFVSKLAEIRAKKGLTPPTLQTPPPAEKWDNKEDLLPDLGGPELSEADRELDQLVNNIDIIDAYKRWCGKMIPDPKGKRESIMISCPKPDHADKDPSAWINLDKQTWFCGGCQEGGDAHDIAAYHFGYPVPGYKDPEHFHKLRLNMGESFGFRTKSVPGGQVSWVEPPTDVVQPSENTDVSVPPATGEAAREGDPDDEQIAHEAGTAPPVAHMWADEDEEQDLIKYPTINWVNLVPEDTFLYEYMKACTNDDAPEEYHFWHGLMALGLVAGRNVTLDDTQPVYGNLLLCVLGATGTGKSRSRRHLNHVLREAAPYTEDGTRTFGVKNIPVPSSGEYLVSEFAYIGKDPGNAKITLGPQSVTGIVDFDEMSALLSRANRQGSSLKPTLMALADAVPEVKIGSLMRGDYSAHNAFCSITASTQPKAIRSLLNHNDTGSGFLNRWVFAGGKTKEIEVIGGSRSAIRVDLATAVELLSHVRGWAGFERSITMDDDAYDEYKDFFRANIEPAKTKDETDLLKRIDLITKKIMLLLTINLKLESVPLQVVEAMKVLFFYVLECYGILNSNIGVTQMQDVMSEIERHIIRHQDKTGRGASPRDIAKYTKRKNYSLEQIKKSLEVMTALDIIELEPKTSNVGRPVARYRAVV